MNNNSFVEVSTPTQLSFSIAVTAVLFIGAQFFFRREGRWQRRLKQISRSRTRLGGTIGFVLIGMSLFSHLLQSFWEEFLRTGGNYQFIVPGSPSYFLFLANPVILAILATWVAPKHLLTGTRNEKRPVYN